MAAPAGIPGPPVITGAIRQLNIPSCVLAPKDLRELYKLLEQKAGEAADLQIASFVRQPSQTQQQFDEFCAGVRQAMKLVVRVQMDNGQWVGAMTMDPLTDEQFPSRVVRVEYNSAFIYHSQWNQFPNNNFSVILDFSRPSVLDMNALPLANMSNAAISGLNATWTNGLYEELNTFFSQRRTRRGWLHFSHTYTLLAILVGFPLSFRVLSYIAPVIRRRTALPDALTVAVYVYIVLVVLFLFRLTFNYARWVFPATEVDARHQHVAVAHKAAILALGSMI